MAGELCFHEGTAPAGGAGVLCAPHLPAWGDATFSLPHRMGQLLRLQAAKVSVMASGSVPKILPWSLETSPLGGH